MPGVQAEGDGVGIGVVEKPVDAGLGVDVGVDVGVETKLDVELVFDQPAQPGLTVDQITPLLGGQIRRLGERPV